MQKSIILGAAFLAILFAHFAAHSEAIRNSPSLAIGAGSGPATGNVGGTGMSPELEAACKIGMAGVIGICSLYGTEKAGAAIEASSRMPQPPMCGGDNRQVNQTPLRDTFNEKKAGCGADQQPHYSQTEGRLTIGAEMKYPNGSNDCSAKVTSDLARAGACEKPGQPFKAPLTTETLIGYGGAGDCFEVVSDGRLLPGDVFVERHGGEGHTWKVQQMAGANGQSDVCSGDAASNKDKIIIDESTSGGDKLGNSARDISKHAGNGGSNVGKAYNTLWPLLCGKQKAEFDQGEIKGKILRHKMAKDPACKCEPVMFEKEQCVQDCVPPYLKSAAK